MQGAVARGFMPVVFDNLERGHEWAVKWGPLEHGDIRNEKDLNRVFEAQRPWAVVHFAAYAYVGESTLEPSKYYDTNVGGTAKLLKACAAFGCRNVVFSSSCATYGAPERLPLKEDDEQKPVNPYGYTKLVVERMLKDAEIAYGMRHVALRYFNAAGADPDGELGELHQPETHLIPLVLFAAMGRLPFRSKYSAMIILHRMAPVSVITCTSVTWPTRMWPPSNGSPRAIRAILQSRQWPRFFGRRGRENE